MKKSLTLCTALLIFALNLRAGIHAYDPPDGMERSGPLHRSGRGSLII
jgi:hypothetical protein